jgi:hypothetical protein
VVEITNHVTVNAYCLFDIMGAYRETGRKAEHVLNLGNALGWK